MSIPFRRKIGLFVSLALLAAAGLAALSGRACDTPVYRYAMYRWQPAPYELYYFHREKLTDEAAKIKDRVDQASSDQKLRANVVFLPVDLDEDKELTGVPADVKAAWLAQEESRVPSFMLVTPRGGQVYTGPLGLDDVGRLLESPARAKFAQLLEEGSTGVFVLLDGKDAAANKAAFEAAQSVVADVETGKIKLYSGAADMFPGAPGGGPPGVPGTAPKGPQNREAKAGDAKDGGDEKTDGKLPKSKVGLIRIARDDEREAWLRRSLMATERGLDTYADEPMLFAVYGRGRALPAYIGDGISRDNLLDCLYFISGACSCTVKEQNPGVDLLVRYDWNKAAENLGEIYGSEEGNDRFGVENMFPSLVFGAPSQGKPAQGETAGAEAKEDPEIAAQADAIIAAQEAKEKPDQETRSQKETDAPSPGAGTKETDDAGKPATQDAGKSDDSAGNDRNDGNDRDEKAEEAGSARQPAPGDEQASPAKNAAPTAGAADPESRQVALNTATSGAAGKPDDDQSDDVAAKASTTLWYTLGVGVGIALFVLVSATLLLYRPK